jgi:hypothetical protein
MKAEAYLKLKGKHEKEMNDFPIAYAFDGKQLEEALEKLGATKEECVTVFGHGDVMKKVDVPRFNAMLKRQDEELLEAMKDDDFAEGAFLYEMDNHEYAINWSGDEDVLACFNMNTAMLREMGLVDAYRRARHQHMKNAEEWGMI